MLTPSISQRPCGAVLSLVLGLALLPACSGGGGGSTAPAAPAKVTGGAPADGAQDVPTSTLLSWNQAENATSYAVYVGDDAALDDDFLGFRDGDQTDTTVPGMQEGATYFWRVDSQRLVTNPDGSVETKITVGDVWSFSTAGPPDGPPGAATNPSPANGATSPLHPTLAWGAAPGADAYELFLGTDPSLGWSSSRGIVTTASFAPGTLADSLVHYWRVDSINAFGRTPGPVWSFTVQTVPSLFESEPNGSTGTADALTIGRRGYGQISSPLDEDYWSFDLEAGQAISVEVLGMAVDQEGWDGADSQVLLELKGPDGANLLDHFGGLPVFATYRADLGFPAFAAPVAGTYTLAVGSNGIGAPGSFYSLRVRSLQGAAVQQEAESAQDPMATGANENIASAEPLEPGALRGFYVDGERDFYRIEVPPAPGLIQVEIFAWRNGKSRGSSDYFDPTLRLFDDQGTLLLFNDDFRGRDSKISYAFDGTPLQDGDPPFELFLEVDEWAGAASADYLLTYTFLDGSDVVEEQEPNTEAPDASPLAYGDIAVGELEPGVNVDFWSFQGQQGDLVHVRVLSAPNSHPDTGFTQDVGVLFFDLTDPQNPVPLVFSNEGGDWLTFMRVLSRTTTYGIQILANASDAAGYGLLLERRIDATWEAEVPGGSSNNLRSNAEPFPDSGSAAGVLFGSGDVDWYEFLLTEGETLELALYCGDSATNRLTNNGYGSTLRAELQAVFDAAGTIVAEVANREVGESTGENLTTSGASATISFEAPGAGIYQVRVSEVLNDGSPNQSYVLQRR